ncbi:MAG: amidohydrolase family protein [Candidatus Heimdallarchaeaceae archaeon]
MKGIIIEADYVITCDEHDTIIRDGAVYVEGDRIKAIGKSKDIRSYYAASRIIEGENKILLPGLVNTHSHSVQTLLRGKADDLDLIDWLQLVILPGERDFAPKDVYTSCLAGFAEMIRTGTTTCNDMLTTHDSEEGIRAAIDIGIRARIGKMLMDTNDIGPEGIIEDTDKVLSDVKKHIDQYHNSENGRIKYSLNARFLLSCSPGLMKELVKIQKNHDDVLLHTHASENKNETKLVEQKFGKSYIRALQKLGVLGEKTILAHAIWLDEEEYNIIKTTKTRISHNPSSNSKLASGICDVSKFHELNVVVGLATDGAPCNNNLDMFREIRLASFLQKVKYLNEKALPALKALRMATIEGAKAIHLDKEIGSIEIGKKADIILVDINGINALPLYDPISHLVYAADGKDVTLTMIDGSIVYEDGKFTTINIEELKENVIEYVNKRA